MYQKKYIRFKRNLFTGLVGFFLLCFILLIFGVTCCLIEIYEIKKVINYDEILVRDNIIRRTKR